MSALDKALHGLRALIADGALRPGDRLPSEGELCETLGVSRGSLREAIRTLGALGVLETRHGSGSYVSELRAADLLTMQVAWKYANGTMTNGDAAMAKLFASEMGSRVTDHAIQILGGMGLMDELPLEMLWRDSRIERVWEGTSEIQRHIISRELLRPLEG